MPTETLHKHTVTPIPIVHHEPNRHSHIQGSNPNNKTKVNRAKGQMVCKGTWPSTSHEMRPDRPGQAAVHPRRFLHLHANQSQRRHACFRKPQARDGWCEILFNFISMSKFPSPSNAKTLNSRVVLPLASSKWTLSDPVNWQMLRKGANASGLVHAYSYADIRFSVQLISLGDTGHDSRS